MTLLSEMSRYESYPPRLSRRRCGRRMSLFAAILAAKGRS
jgi:hypothetical protein